VVTPADLAPLQVERQVGQAQLAVLARLGRAARHRADAGRQLGEREGLAQVVVGPGVESRHAVLDFVARGEHEDTRPDPIGAQAAADLEPVDVGQPEVEDDEVVGAA